MSFTQEEIDLASEAWCLGLLSNEEFAAVVEGKTLYQWKDPMDRERSQLHTERWQDSLHFDEALGIA